MSKLRLREVMGDVQSQSQELGLSFYCYLQRAGLVLLSSPPAPALTSHIRPQGLDYV